MRTRTKIGTAALLTAALFLAAAPPAMAAGFVSGTKDCSGGKWSWSGVNSSASATHRHNWDGSTWRERTYPSGISGYKGVYNPGPVYMTVQTSGTFYAGTYFGCAT